MTTAIAIIPARYASQRLPAKPLADIGGKPMIRHVYERTAKATLIEKVIVATDDHRIVEAVHAFGGIAVLTPTTLQSGTERVAFAARSLPDGNIVVNVQGDEPLLSPEMIDEGVRLVAESDAVAGTLVKKIELESELFNPNVVKVVLGKEGDCLYFSRSPIPFGRDTLQSEWLHHAAYYKHIGLYVFRSSFLRHYSTLHPTPLERAEKLEQLRILEHGYRMRAAVTMHDSVPVDTQEDLDRVRLIYQQRHERS